MKVLPAIVSVPERAENAVLAATVKPSVPLADPDAPLVIVIHPALLTLVHAQLDVTFTLPTPPLEPTVCPAEEIVEPHVVVSENAFETALGVDPPGPLAKTRAS